MKKFILTIILILMSICSFGQEIVIPKKQILYLIPNPALSYNKQYIPTNAIVKTKNIISGKWNVLKFTNVGNSLNRYYDAIIVSPVSKLENRIYLIKYEDLGEYKYLVDDANRLIQTEYDKIDLRIADLQDSIIFVNNQYCLDTLEINKTYRDSVLIYKELENNMLSNVVSSVNRFRDSLYNTFPPKIKTFVENLNIKEFSITGPNSAGGCDIKFSYKNTNEKTIKYLNFICTFYNAVNDKVYDEIRHYCTFNGKDTGPVYFNQAGGGRWSNAIYNYSTEYAVINSISIIYLDGSTYSVKFTRENSSDILLYFYLVNIDYDNYYYRDNEFVKLYQKIKTTFNSEYNRLKEQNKQDNKNLLNESFAHKRILNEQIRELMKPKYFEVVIYDDFSYRIINK